MPLLYFHSSVYNNKTKFYEAGHPESGNVDQAKFCTIGLVSSLVGIGGGTLSVPFMLWCNIPLHQAIGTSAAIGFPIAIAGTVGYIYNGLSAVNLPEYTLGYVYLPALGGLIITSVLTAPIGVRLAHSLPVNKLKQVFAGLLLLVATRMLISIF
jgi:uncharacterized membrane protein YfcA